LRLALPLMSSQESGVHPLAYAVWFEHLRGRNAALSQALQALTAGGRKLNDAQTQQLYLQHVAEAGAETTQRVNDELRRLMHDMADSAKATGNQTQRFGQSLERISASTHPGETLDAASLAEVVQQTQEMREAVSALNARLESSQQEIDQLRHEISRVRKEALVDALTGLPNRRAFEQALATITTRGDKACLLVADLDHFKKINDTFGHLFGDTVLRAAAQALKTGLVAKQMAARVGGEEFAVLAPGLDLSEAMALADRLRQMVGASRIKRRDNQQQLGNVTVSLGVAAWQVGEPVDSWFERADRALYVSKAAGRNRVTAAPAKLEAEPSPGQKQAPPPVSSGAAPAGPG
jgi:diguanylate cyclase